MGLVAKGLDLTLATCPEEEDKAAMSDAEGVKKKLAGIGVGSFGRFVDRWPRRGLPSHLWTHQHFSIKHISDRTLGLIETNWSFLDLLGSFLISELHDSSLSRDMPFRLICYEAARMLLKWSIDNRIATKEVYCWASKVQWYYWVNLSLQNWYF